MIYKDPEELENALNQLQKDAILNILFFLTRFAIIDSDLYLHGLLISNLHSKTALLTTVDFIKLFNIYKTLKMIYSQVLNLEPIGGKKEIPANEISLMKFEGKIRDLVYYFFTIKNPQMDSHIAIDFIRSGLLENKGKSLIPDNIISQLLKGIDLDQISIKELLQHRHILSSKIGIENYTLLIMDRILNKDKRALIELDFNQLSILIRIVSKYDSKRIQLLYNYCSNIIERKIYDLTLNLDSLCDIIHSFVLSKQINKFSDPILISAIPIINIVGLESLAAGKRLEILWSLVIIAKEDIENPTEVSHIRSILPHLQKLENMSYAETLKIYHFIYIADINQFYETVHGKPLFDKYVLSRCEKVRRTLFKSII